MDSKLLANICLIRIRCCASLDFNWCLDVRYCAFDSTCALKVSMICMGLYDFFDTFGHDFGKLDTFQGRVYASDACQLISIYICCIAQL